MEDSNHSNPSKWEILARERNSRVIVCHTPDTYVLANLAKSADRAMRGLRNYFVTGIDPHEAADLVTRYYDIVIELHKLIQTVCQKLNIKYKPPRSIKKILEMTNSQTYANEDPDSGP